MFAIESIGRDVVMALVLSFVLASIGRAADSKPAFLDPAEAGPDFAIQGEYAGPLIIPAGANTPTRPENVGIQVIALGNGQFHAVMYRGGLPGDGWDKGPKESADGGFEKDANGNSITSLKGNFRTNWNATIGDGTLTLRNLSGEKVGELKKVDRKSPTLGAKPPAGAIVLFEGSNTDAWQEGTLTADKLLFPPAATKQSFNDCTLHIEFRLPFMPEARGQGRGNSGVYLQRRYECQVLDSFGLKGENNECGGFYQQHAPAVNMCYPPLAWQTYDIDFTAPRYDNSGAKTQNARVTARHNGILILDNVELAHETPGEQKEANSPGPVYLQFHGNPVHYRNIWLVEKK
jgi:hypothetical protein